MDSALGGSRLALDDPYLLLRSPLQNCTGLAGSSGFQFASAPVDGSAPTSSNCGGSGGEIEFLPRTVSKGVEHQGGNEIGADKPEKPRQPRNAPTALALFHW